MKMVTKPVRKENPVNPQTGAEIHILRRFVRLSVDDCGCGLDHCNCSPENFLTVADGETLIMIEFTKEEAEAMRSGFCTISED